MSGNFKKKICLITGARKGIGLSIGQTLAQNGYRVIFSGRKLNDCKDPVNPVSYTHLTLPTIAGV